MPDTIEHVEDYQILTNPFGKVRSLNDQIANLEKIGYEKRGNPFKNRDGIHQVMVLPVKVSDEKKTAMIQKHIELKEFVESV